MSKINFNKEQLAVIEQIDNTIEASSLEAMFGRTIDDLSLDDLLSLLKIANALYRSSTQIVSDSSSTPQNNQFAW